MNRRVPYLQGLRHPTTSHHKDNKVDVFLFACYIILSLGFNHQ